MLKVDPVVVSVLVVHPPDGGAGGAPAAAAAAQHHERGLDRLLPAWEKIAARDSRCSLYEMCVTSAPSQAPESEAEPPPVSRGPSAHRQS